MYDYFLLDYQQNVRMVLSEEVRVASNTATMETTRASVEEPIFGQVGTGNEVAVTRYPAGNTGWTGNATGSVSRLGNLAGQNIGPNTLQKVMAGDVVLANAQYYYEGSAGGSNNGFVNNVLQSLLQALTNGPASELVKGGAGNVTSQLNLNPGFATAVQPPNSNGGPLAYLTVLFFDERFNFIPEADGGAYRQQVAASVTASGASLTLTGLKAPKNGYCYIYVSNQSDQAVYFDNLAVTISQGNIIEENHYYSFGLRIASISSKKYSDAYDGHAKNDYQMQGAFSEMDDDIGWNDFALRNYDPQTGRFVQQDPFQQFSSPYVGMGNDPVNMIDPSGGIGIPCPGTSALSIFLDNAVYAVGNAFNSVSNVLSIAGRISSVTSTSTSIVNAVNAGSIINAQLVTNGVGNTGAKGRNENGEAADKIDEWIPLTKEWLYSYVEREANFTLSKSQLHQQVGFYFEDIWDAYASINTPGILGYQTNPIINSGGKQYRPDGVSNSQANDYDFWGRIKKTTYYGNAHWYEVKARNGSIYMSSDEGQIKEYINQVAVCNIQATVDNASAITIVTTANMTISKGVRSHAYNTVVQFIHEVAYFKTNKAGQLIVKFALRTSTGQDIFREYAIPATVPFRKH